MSGILLHTSGRRLRSTDPWPNGECAGRESGKLSDEVAPMTNRNPRKRHKPFKVLIVDGHPVVREGLSIKIAREQNLEVCGEADNVPQALQLVKATDPDLVITDISLRSGNGLDLIKRIKQRNKATQVIVWSLYPDTLYAERALHAGALGYLNKDEPTDKLIGAIRRVIAGHIYLSKSMTERILLRASRVSHEIPPAMSVASLSDRELEAFQLIGWGLDSREMAKRMYVSPKTINTYLTRIKAKLGVNSTEQLMQAAMKLTLPEN